MGFRTPFGFLALSASEEWQGSQEEGGPLGLTGSSPSLPSPVSRASNVSRGREGFGL